MAALFNGLTDRNAAVRSCFANTLGNLVKVSCNAFTLLIHLLTMITFKNAMQCAKDSSVEKLLSKLEEWYIDKDDKSLQDSCGLVIQSMLRYSPDLTKSYAAYVLPLAFFAMHEAGMSFPAPRLYQTSHISKAYLSSRRWRRQKIRFMGRSLDWNDSR